MNVVDPGLEDGDVLSERIEIALENLAPTALVGQRCLDAPKRLRDGVIPLFETLQAPVDLVEVAEDLLAELGEAAVTGIESPIDGVKAPIAGFEAPIDGFEARTKELNELFVLRGRHASISTLSSASLQVSRRVDTSERSDLATGLLQ